MEDALANFSSFYSKNFDMDFPYKKFLWKTFLNFRLGKDYTKQIPNDLVQIEQYCTTNFLTLKSVNITMDSIQKLASNHFNKLSSLTASYKNEAKIQQDSLNQVKCFYYLD